MLYYRHDGREVGGVSARYNKPRKLLFGRKIRGCLSIVAGVSVSAMAKLSHGKPVSLGISGRICRALDCEIGDVVEPAREAGEW